MIVARVAGKGARALFAGESGGHRWQRVPPTEKRGRVHTSTVTVAELPEPRSDQLRIAQRDIQETFTGGGGKGGQHQNKRSTAVVLVHKPTGIRVRIEGRSQHANRLSAMEILRARVLAEREHRSRTGRNATRRDKIGSGMRGDKVRTVQVPRGTVVDHLTGKRTSYRRYRRGFLRDLR